MDLDLLGWVKASDYRKEILLCLTETEYLTPTEIEERTDLYLSHVSGTLTDMEGRNIVECVTPKRRKGKLYSLTSDGEEIADEIGYDL